MQQIAPKRKGVVYAPDPTPEEIRERCSTIRRGWTDTIRRQRMSNVDVAWTPPETCSIVPLESAHRGFSTAREG